MKTLPIAIILLCLLSSSAIARIGESLQMCKQRYGAPTLTDNGFVYFEKSGFIIIITFYEGKADSISFRKAEENALGQGVDISDNEVKQFMKLNGGEREWKKTEGISVDRQWRTEDGELLSNYETFKNFLSIVTKGRIERDAEKQEAKENESLEGF